MGNQPASAALRSPFLGTSRAAREVRSIVLRAARSDIPVLILGESGVGKELVAREIHMRSARSDGPFVPLNCAAIPESLIESELFGHTAGAYTDARSSARGAFELADKGTLLLDEIGELSPLAQPKLLRALESNEVRPVGAERMTAVDIRVISSTNHDLRLMHRRGTFRSDLYYRLNVLEIRVAPLRDRLEDIPELTRHFASRTLTRWGRPFHGVAPEAIRKLQSHNWPGNVRELRSAIERAVALSSVSFLDASSFEFESSSCPETKLQRLLSSNWETANRGFERIYVAELLGKYDGNVRRAAQAAKLTPRAVYKIIARAGLRRRPAADDR